MPCPRLPAEIWDYINDLRWKEYFEAYDFLEQNLILPQTDTEGNRFVIRHHRRCGKVRRDCFCAALHMWQDNRFTGMRRHTAMIPDHKSGFPMFNRRIAWYETAI